MADFKVEKKYSESLRKLETTDRAHADLFNSMFSTLINNDAYLDEQNNKIKQPEFDDSGSVDEIKDFPSFLSSMVSKMSIFKFFSDLKAGLKFVLHTGQIVNNCVTDRSDLPGSAHNDKVLMDKYLALSSDLSEKLAMTTFNTHKTSGDHDSRYYTEAEINSKFNSLTKIVSTSYTGNGSGRRTISINFNVYNLIIKPQNSINILGGDGGDGNYTVTEECNQSGVIYFVVLFGTSK